MLNQTVEYAITALTHVATMNQPVIVREIAKAVNIPGPYLAKVINVLSRKGFVDTQRGIGGGVTLAKPSKSITLFDLCTALDDPILANDCLLGNSFCAIETACHAHGFWSKQKDKELTYLKKTTVADLAEFFLKGKSKSNNRVK